MPGYEAILQNVRHRASILQAPCLLRVQFEGSRGAIMDILDEQDFFNSEIRYAVKISGKQ